MTAMHQSRFLLLWSVFHLMTPGLQADPLDDYLAQEMKKQHIPGLALAVLKEGKIVKAEGYGWADLEGKIPVKPNTVFQLQSITKSFTATGIMMLVEEGKIGLDHPIGSYLEGLPDDWGRITVRHLLTHTSGLKDFINEPTVDLRKDLTPQEVIRSLAGLPLNFKPGEKYAYSNTGYHLLGMIMFQATGKSWGEFLQERIFAPRGMSETEIISSSVKLANLAKGYGWDKDQWAAGDFIAPTILGYAGGGILSTVLDLAKWDSTLSTGKLLKKESLEQMWASAKLNNGTKSGYGLGWGIGDLRGHRFVNHSGGHATGFRTTFLRFRDDPVTIAVLTNLRGANPEEIANRVAEHYIPALRLSALPEGPSADPELPRRLRDSLNALGANQDSPWVSPGFRAEFRNNPAVPAKLAERLREVKSFVFLASEEIGGRGIERSGVPVQRVCHCKMVTGSETRYYTFYLGPDDKVAFVQSSL